MFGLSCPRHKDGRFESYSRSLFTFIFMSILEHGKYFASRRFLEFLAELELTGTLMYTVLGGKHC